MFRPKVWGRVEGFPVFKRGASFYPLPSCHVLALLFTLSPPPASSDTFPSATSSLCVCFILFALHLSNRLTQTIEKTIDPLF
ncbi:hypothetical protein L1887_24835 [Cichorium endivia]|nr:hypothetical protein L1887_24835 [Cichorium endivia]